MALAGHGSRFDYAADTDRWLPWQREYLYGVLLIFPPSGVIEEIDALRATYDPRSAASCQAHISLSEPLPRPLTDTPLSELRDALRGFGSFDVEFARLLDSPCPGVAYAIEPRETVLALRSLVHCTSLFDSELKRAAIPPHMTIAEFVTYERSQQLREELEGNLPTGRFLCDAVEYAVADEDFRFHRVLTLALT